MVAFRLFINMVNDQDKSVGSVVSDLFQLSFGAVLLGLVWAFAVILLLGRVQGDATVESTLPVAMAYLLFYVAEKVGRRMHMISICFLRRRIAHVFSTVFSLCDCRKLQCLVFSQLLSLGSVSRGSVCHSLSGDRFRSGRLNPVDPIIFRGGG
jgi:predicted membrane-bound spermidine synthase